MSPDELRAFKESTGLSSHQVARLAHIDMRTIRDWSSGTKPVPQWAEDWLGRLAAALGDTAAQIAALEAEIDRIQSQRDKAIQATPVPDMPIFAENAGNQRAAGD